MKKILSIAVTCALSAGSYAQYMVSTTPSNRNVLLEDLTGIFCGYCPDGAKVADNLKAGAPSRVVIIGNHAGYYAQPGNVAQAQFDLRTTEGTTIDGLSDAAGYPAGNINRRVTAYAMNPGKTAMGRGSWSVAASEVMAIASPVNLAVEAFYYTGTNVIEVNVEGYYTANGTGSDYLTVAVLQDNIDTYQSGASSYPSRVQGNGLYRQMDVLRAYVTTPVTGEEISTTTSGTHFDRQYSYTVAQVGPDIAPVIDDMKIAIWLSEDLTFSEVITATVTEVGSRAVGINEATSLKDLEIYPNPFVNNATVEFNLESAQSLTLNVYDVTGKLIQNNANTFYAAGNHKINISGEGMESGLYYVNIIAQDGIITRRLILNK